MLYVLVSWFLNALSLMIVAHVVPGFHVQSAGSALIAALVIGLINSTLGPLLKILTLPLTIVICNRDGVITVAELVRGVAVSLGLQTLSQCPSIAGGPQS